MPRPTSLIYTLRRPWRYPRNYLPGIRPWYRSGPVRASIFRKRSSMPQLLQSVSLAATAYRRASCGSHRLHACNRSDPAIYWQEPDHRQGCCDRSDRGPLRRVEWAFPPWSPVPCVIVSTRPARCRPWRWHGATRSFPWSCHPRQDLWNWTRYRSLRAQPSDTDWCPARRNPRWVYCHWVL